MLDPVGFWSYARLDEQQSGGHLSQLPAIVGNEIGLRHGGTVTLWQDVTAIPYGANWAGEIEEARRRKASALRLRHSQSFASLRQRPSVSQAPASPARV